jgi:hypothetical protein
LGRSKHLAIDANEIVDDVGFNTFNLFSISASASKTTGGKRQSNARMATTWR